MNILLFKLYKKKTLAKRRKFKETKKIMTISFLLLIKICTKKENYI